MPRRSRNRPRARPESATTGGTVGAVGTDADETLASSPQTPVWQVARCISMAPVVEEVIGARLALLARGLTGAEARDLVRTVASSDADRSLLVATAAPSLRRVPRRGRLSATDTERLVRLGTLFTLLRAAYGSESLAREILHMPVPALGDRSALACADTLTAIERAQDLFVPYTITIVVDAPASP